jgi:hypothetical protein
VRLLENNYNTNILFKYYLNIIYIFTDSVRKTVKKVGTCEDEGTFSEDFFPFFSIKEKDKR